MALVQLLESVPNFSEGRRADIIQMLTQAAGSVPGARVLDLHTDVDHNRCVVTVAGEPEAVGEAVFRATAVATEHIDLRVHQGAHPRLGAADVVPFIPIQDLSMEDAVEIAHRFGRRVHHELGVPVYFYEEAALRSDRRNLEQVRGRGFEVLAELVATVESHAPDIGPARLHPSAGAVIVGARGPLIAYNIFLNTNDLKIARAVARTVRHSSGGLRYVKALGIDIPARGQVQVSMNLTDYRRTAIHTVFELVRSAACSFGVTITDSEVVGLIPEDALLEAARHYLRLHGFRMDQILERRLREEPHHG